MFACFAYVQATRELLPSHYAQVKSVLRASGDWVSDQVGVFATDNRGCTFLALRSNIGAVHHPGVREEVGAAPIPVDLRGGVFPNPHTSRGYAGCTEEGGMQ